MTKTDHKTFFVVRVSLIVAIDKVVKYAHNMKTVLTETDTSNKQHRKLQHITAIGWSNKFTLGLLN